MHMARTHIILIGACSLQELTGEALPPSLAPDPTPNTQEDTPGPGPGPGPIIDRGAVDPPKPPVPGPTPSPLQPAIAGSIAACVAVLLAVAMFLVYRRMTRRKRSQDGPDKTAATASSLPPGAYTQGWSAPTDSMYGGSMHGGSMHGSVHAIMHGIRPVHMPAQSLHAGTDSCSKYPSQNGSGFSRVRWHFPLVCLHLKKHTFTAQCTAKQEL